MAGGGSLSGTALNVSAGARTRWALIVQAVVVVVVILVFSDLLSRIPMAALAALLIYSAVLSIKWVAIATIRRTSPVSMTTMVATFLATLVVPLQQAVILGVVLAAVLFVYRASTDVRIYEMTVDHGRLVVGDAPAALMPNAVTVLDIIGNLFYAGARTLQKKLPDVGSGGPAVVVMRVRGQSDVGSTFFKVISAYAQDLRKQGGRLILAGLDPIVEARMRNSGLLEEIGEEHIFLAGSVIGESTAAAIAAGEAWLGGSEESIAGRAPSEDREIVSIDEAGEQADRERPVEEHSEPVDQPAAAAVPDLVIWSRIGPLLLRRFGSWSDYAGMRAILGGALMAALGILAVLLSSEDFRIVSLLTGGLATATAAIWIGVTIRQQGLEAPLVGLMRMLSAGALLTSAGAMVIEPFTDALDGAAILAVLGVVLLIVAATTLALEVRTSRRLFLSPGIAMSGALTAIGAILLFETHNGESGIESVGQDAIIAGFVAIGAGVASWWRRRRASQAETAPRPTS
jgi:anti-anti-sigma regulatory factor